MLTRAETLVGARVRRSRNRGPNTWGSAVPFVAGPCLRVRSWMRFSRSLRHARAELALGSAQIRNASAYVSKAIAKESKGGGKGDVKGGGRGKGKGKGRAFNAEELAGDPDAYAAFQAEVQANLDAAAAPEQQQEQP